jgi:hypothetical protein
MAPPTGSQWNYCTGRGLTDRVLADIVKTLQHPADRAITAANQNPVLWHVAKDVETRQRSTIAQVKHLVGVEKLAE